VMAKITNSMWPLTTRQIPCVSVNAGELMVETVVSPWVSPYVMTYGSLIRCVCPTRSCKVVTG
jgi:hypothetical protein